MGEITPAIKSDSYALFLARVDVSGGPDACHTWTGARDLRGYGRLRRSGKSYLAHRWLMGYLRGVPLEREEHVLHHCDNPPCVNPRHLYVGDHAQNMRDMIERDRRWNTQSRKTHCPEGHPYDEANTYRSGGHRYCRACRREAQRRYLARKRGA